MKIRIMLRRIVQLPDGKQIKADYHSFVVDILKKDTLDYLNCADYPRHPFSFDWVGIDTNPVAGGVTDG